MLPRYIGFMVTVLAALGFAPGLGAAQTGGGARWNEVFVGSELEHYLRLLQVAGESKLYPWAVRAFGPGELDRLAPRDSAHPWAERFGSAADSGQEMRLALIPPRAELIYNSGFPFGSNDGPIWAGRGLTGVFQAGFSARWGAASLVVAPVVYHSRNDAFVLAENREGALSRFADNRYPLNIDLPQRFGKEPITEIDPGQTTLRLDLPYVTAGISTANQHWGPALAHPILMGNNAAGYLHGFLGTSSPVDLWIGKLHGRAVWGQLDQSEYSPVEGVASRRFMSGLVAVFTPRGAPGLEIGGGRFFHTPWPEGGLSAGNFAKPLEGLLKRDLSDRSASPDTAPDTRRSDADNQLASVFARWVLPRSGFEVYGEYGREDHNWDLRDLALEPDHISAYMLGLRKVWKRADSAFVAIRGEVLNAQPSHLAQVRPQFPLYTHGSARQGHTHRGQLLGSGSAFGGAAALLAVDAYHGGGRWTFGWTRQIRQERVGRPGIFWTSDDLDPDGLDALHALSAEGLFFRGRYDVTAGLTGVYNLNRNFESDAFNLNAVLRVRVGL